MINIAQIGVGYWGKNLLRNFAGMAGCQVSWVCDQSPSVREAVASSYPGIKTTDNPDDLWKDAALDAIVVATNAPTHATLVTQALRSGKHVFVEKPLALFSEDAKTMVEEADLADRILMVGHLLEYHPAYVWLDGQIKAGTLGEVRYLYSTRVNLGRVRTDENALWSLAPHDFSVMLMLLDEEPSRVSATGQAYLQPGIEDVVFVTVSFPSGKTGNIHVSWLDPHKIRQLTVVGTKAMAVLDDISATEKIRIYDHGIDVKKSDDNRPYTSYAEALTLRQGDISIPAIPMTEPLKLECQAFLDAIESGVPPPSDGRDGMAVVRLLEASQKSLERNGEPVEL